MNVNEIITAVSSVGFPIVCSVAMGYFCKYLIDKYTQIITDTMNKLSDSIDELKQELKEFKHDVDR